MEKYLSIHQALVVQMLDSVIYRINHYPANKYWGKKLHYPLNKDLSGGWRYPAFEQPRPVYTAFLFMGHTLWKGNIVDIIGINRFNLLCKGNN